MRLIFVLALSAVVLSGCGTVGDRQFRFRTALPLVADDVEIDDSVQRAKVGDLLFTQRLYLEDRVVLTEALNEPHAGIRDTEFRLDAGTELFRLVTRDTWPMYCTLDIGFYRVFRGENRRGIVCLGDQDQDGRFDFASAFSNRVARNIEYLGFLVEGVDLVSGAAYQPTQGEAAIEFQYGVQLAGRVDLVSVEYGGIYTAFASYDIEVRRTDYTGTADDGDSLRSVIIIEDRDIHGYPQPSSDQIEDFETKTGFDALNAAVFGDINLYLGDMELPTTVEVMGVNLELLELTDGELVYRVLSGIEPGMVTPIGYHREQSMQSYTPVEAVPESLGDKDKADALPGVIEETELEAGSR